MFSFTQPSFNADTNSVAGGCLFKSGPSHFCSCGVFLLASALVHFYVFTWSRRSIELQKSSRPSNVVRGILNLTQAPVSPNHPEFALIHQTQFQAFTDLVAGGLHPQSSKLEVYDVGGCLFDSGLSHRNLRRQFFASDFASRILRESSLRMARDSEHMYDEPPSESCTDPLDFHPQRLLYS
jgi:hypothetical protein